jgi:galactose-1-phosphate uridylyltransferase
MQKYRDYYQTMPDGTVKQVNPFTGTEVWCVPGRSHRPYTQHPHPPERLKKANEGRACPFCFKRLFETPPEKSRLVKSGEKYLIQDYVRPGDLLKRKPLFRRIPNLFEIVSFSYWQKNFGFTPCGKVAKWKAAYLSSPRGRRHAEALLQAKFALSGKSEADFRELCDDAKLDLLNAFFAGTHEVITAGGHYILGAKTDHELFSSGDMTPEEHYQYMRFTLHAMEEIRKNNPYVRYVSVFQNWLKPAGASFDHLHKQLVGLDEWGVSIKREIAMVRKRPEIYNDMAVNFAVEHGWVAAENDHAIAFADFGHRYPTLAIYSKSKRSFPADLDAAELRGFSDLVHACHAAMGRHISCNEEWYYRPKDLNAPMPWHILIKWRTLTTAGFEGGTRIYINPYSPERICGLIVPQLEKLALSGKIAPVRIGNCSVSSKNCLKYLA